jgi:hypothetical protein
LAASPYFRLVEAHRAGPAAIGILVPPGPRTAVIVRPRSLDWDLVLVPQRETMSAGQPAWELEREKAARLVQDLQRALGRWPLGGQGSAQAVASSSEGGWQVVVEVGPLILVACRRRPGQAYQAVRFAREEEAKSAALILQRILCPQMAGVQELYLNTRSFSR